jgi:hypothetical protein
MVPEAMCPVWVPGACPGLVWRSRAVGPLGRVQVKRQARYLRDLQPFVGSMTFAYRKGALNEDDPLSRRPDIVPLATFPLFWDGEVPSYRELRR